MGEQVKLPEGEAKPTEKSVVKPIEKPNLGLVLIGTDEERKAKIESFIKDFGVFAKKMNEGLSGDDCYKDEQVIALFHEYLDLQVSEYIARKDVELKMLGQQIAEATPASEAQVRSLTKLRDFYPELKSEWAKALEKAGLKSLNNEEMKKLTNDQAHAMMDHLVPFRNKLGFRDKLPPAGNGGFHTADQHEPQDPGNPGQPY